MCLLGLSKRWKARSDLGNDELFHISVTVGAAVKGSAALMRRAGFLINSVFVWEEIFNLYADLNLNNSSAQNWFCILLLQLETWPSRCRILYFLVWDYCRHEHALMMSHQSCKANHGPICSCDVENLKPHSTQEMDLSEKEIVVWWFINFLFISGSHM